MEYDFQNIEAKWQKYWADHKTFAAKEDHSLPKHYSLSMFPYPSGAGLHVGHPLGYIASCIYARYKKLKGFNVLHPMGYDSFGLPAEQYAIQTGQHPAITTEQNIKRYREQLDKLGFSFDWDREVRTSDPSYYKWTQWIFKQLYKSWYNKESDKAEAIETLIEKFEKGGNKEVQASTDQKETFTAEEWKGFSEKEQQKILMNYRLTFLADSWVNWCPALGTVLANDEIKDGVSERGGHPVEQKLMRQWSMRITAYAERLLNDLETIDWTDSIKDQQRNWIGKSVGASVKFKVLSPTLSEGKGEQVQAGYMTGAAESAPKNLQRAKEMRKTPTKAEEELWKALKGKKLGGYKFRRQHLIGHYIVDFVCLQHRLIIEVDGKIHVNQELEDEERTINLNTQGFTVIRFTNEEVLENINTVLDTIHSKLKDLPHIQDKILPVGKDLGWDEAIEIFTTRPDTIFGASFMVLAPEHELVDSITVPEYKELVAEYKRQAGLKTERDRQSDVKNITGQFTGAFALHPFTGEKIPIWIADYVLAGYGTGAVMAVPCGDQRDWDFAKHFDLPIPNIFKDVDVSEGAYDDKDNAVITHSDFLNDLPAKKAIKTAIHEIEKRGIGKGQTNYRLRDAVFSRQRYWGEPFPVYYKDDIPYLIEDDQLPVTLPEVDKYLPTEDGEPPLARAPKDAWDVKFDGDRMEYNTMPGWAGSSWYFLRYMDPHNEKAFVSKEKADYWNQVDLYIGGSEHATGHLLYARFWTKFLFDMGYISFNEPFKKMINQGMILGNSAFVHEVYHNSKLSNPCYVSRDLIDLPPHESEWMDSVNSFFLEQGLNHDEIKELKGRNIPVDVSILKGETSLDIDMLRSWRKEFENALFIENKNGDFHALREIEKMSKSKFNVQTPDELVEKFGADTLRCYEMFLGPLEQSKPWDTQGINGVHNFLRKFWRLFHNEENEFEVTDGDADKKSLKTLHKTIKKVTEDLDRFSFNTGVSNFMIAANELTDQKCNNRSVLKELVILLSPYAPHIAEELWQKLGEKESVTTAQWPIFNEEYLVEAEFAYPVSFNGKMRFKLELPTSMSKEDVEKEVLSADEAQKWLEGKTPKKVIVVPGRIVNVVV